MLVATWNVNSLSVRLPQLIAWIGAVGADVICLQETKLIDEKFPKAEFDALGYNYAFFGEKTYNGVAIISKLPLEGVRRGFIEEEEPSARRFIEAQVAHIY